MEFEHVSVVVIQICGKGNLTTDTDAILGHCCVNDRIVVDINGSIVSRGATVCVDQLNGEAVRIISVRSRQLDGIVVGTHHCAIGKDCVVLIPCEAVCARRSRGHVGVHHDVVRQGVAHDRIRDKHENRIRQNCNSISTNNQRLATGSGLRNFNCIVPNSNVAIQSLRSLTINGIRSLGDHFTIAIPCIELAARNTLANVSGEGDITTFANRIVTLSEVSSNTVNNRNLIGIDNDRSIVETCLTSKITILKKVSNFNNISSSCIDHEILNRFSHTRKFIIGISTILVPLINQIRIIVVVKMSSNGHIATFTDSGFC